jgi:alanyl-tRNA synthetase
MTGNQIRQAYLDFFREKGHAVVPSAPLVLQNDPTTLFTGSGMQPLLPYFLGEEHPLGTRIVDSQKCFRSEDIEEIGDNRHTTFFEMLGNWSFGDYFKQDQLQWLFGFLTQTLQLNPENLVVSVFEGNEAAAEDTEAISIWKELFETSSGVMPGLEGYVEGVKMYSYGEKKNWWSRSGTPALMPVGEPGGTTSEVFYRFDEVTHDPAYGPVCHPNCDCGRFIEIGNSVFMEFVKNERGSFDRLPHRNIDFGGGLERLTAAVQKSPDVYTTDLFSPLIHAIEEKAGKAYADETRKPMRIIADHLRGAVMMMAEGIAPGNKQQGYIVRRLLRRAIIQADTLGMTHNFMAGMVPQLALYFEQIYPELSQQQATIQEWIDEEERKFRKVVSAGSQTLVKQMGKIDSTDVRAVAQVLFDLYQSQGLPFEIAKEMIGHPPLTITFSDDTVLTEAFLALKSSHQQASRTSEKGMFKGGLQDSSEVIVRYHTTTHLLHQALRDILGEEVQQMGSNITSERLRFDFKFPRKLTDGEIAKVEAIVNEKIEKQLPVTKMIQPKDQAVKAGALAFFKETYPDMVSVYTIGNDPEKNWYSKELCGGPHVSNTKEIGLVKVIKEQSVGAGVRRIYLSRI